jgi:dimethylglycine oxidase
MLAPSGGIMCDLTITRLGDDDFLVVTGGAVGRHDVAWMRRHLPDDGSVRLEDLSSALCCLGLWGPRARDVLTELTDDDLSNESFPYMGARTLDVASIPVRALRLSYVGELGWEIYAPTEFGQRLWDEVWSAGRKHDAIALGGAAFDSLRLEKGYRLWGADIDEEHNPYESGLGFVVKLGKGDFIGRAAAARGKEDVRRRLSCMTLADPAVVLLGKEPIMGEDGRVLGYVTSAGWGATVEESIAYGYLPAEYAVPGTRVRIHAERGDHDATVAAEPLFDRAMHRLRDVEPVASP